MNFRPIPITLSVGDALFGKTRQAALGLLFGKDGRSAVDHTLDATVYVDAPERAVR